MIFEDAVRLSRGSLKTISSLPKRLLCERGLVVGEGVKGWLPGGGRRARKAKKYVAEVEPEFNFFGRLVLKRNRQLVRTPSNDIPLLVVLQVVVLYNPYSVQNTTPYYK